MARYKLEEPHFLDNRYYEAGSIVEWPGNPSRKMTPVEEVAQQRKAAYDAARPHMRDSRDLPPRAYAIHDVSARRPGMPRAAGPPAQVPAPSADPANPVRTMETIEARAEFDAQQDKALEAALDTSKPTPQEEAAAARQKAAAQDTHKGAHKAPAAKADK